MWKVISVLIDRQIDLNYVVIGGFPIPLVFCPRTVPIAPVTFGFTVTIMFHKFFSDQIQVNVFAFFNFYSQVHRKVYEIKYYFYLLLPSFSKQRQLMVLHWRLSDSKSPRVFRTLLSIVLLSRLGLQNTPTASLQRGKTPHQRVSQI